MSHVFESENAGDVDCEHERKARVFQKRLFTLVVQDCIEIVKIYSSQIEEIKIVKSSYVWISINFYDHSSLPPGKNK